MEIFANILFSDKHTSCLGVPFNVGVFLATIRVTTFKFGMMHDKLLSAVLLLMPAWMTLTLFWGHNSTKPYHREFCVCMVICVNIRHPKKWRCTLAPLHWPVCPHKPHYYTPHMQTTFTDLGHTFWAIWSWKLAGHISLIAMQSWKLPQQVKGVPSCFSCWMFRLFILSHKFPLLLFSISFCVLFPANQPNVYIYI